MRITEVKPMHCKALLNRMEPIYAGSAIRQTYIAIGTMFRAAVMNDIIVKHPMDGVRYTKPVGAPGDIHFLTVEEQKLFLEVAKRSHNYWQYVLLLETGLRTAEMIGLTWDSIDREKRTLAVSKSLEFRHGEGCRRAGPPKTKHSYRTIPLTNKAYEVLTAAYDERKTMIRFILCDEAGIERFCMHALRHTCATRAIESGMQPKVLQKLLGHASIKMTMDRHVHVTDDSLSGAILAFERSMAV